MPPKKKQQKAKSAPQQPAPQKKKKRVRRRGGASPMAQGSVITVSGDDFIRDVVIDANTVDGAVLVTTPIHPPSWPGTHAASLLASFERYKLLSAHFNVSSRVSSVVGGGYIAGVSTDATRGLAGAEGGRQAKLRVRALAGSVSAPLVQSARVVVPPGNNAQVWRYSDASLSVDVATYGYFFLVLDGKPTFMTGMTEASLSVQVTWRMQLASPTVGATQATGVHAARIPANQKLTKSKEYDRAGDPYHPFNQAWVDAANRFGFQDIIAVSPPLNVAATGDGRFARLSWHSQRDQLRLCFFDTYKKAEDTPEPGPSSEVPLKFAQDGVTSTVDTFLHVIGWRPSTAEEREERLNADFHWALAGPRAYRAALLTRDETSVRVQMDINRSLRKVHDRIGQLEQAVQAQSKGTLLDPVKVMVESPLPLPVSLAPLPIPPVRTAPPSGRVTPDEDEEEPRGSEVSFVAEMLRRLNAVEEALQPRPLADQAPSTPGSFEVLSPPED